MLVLYYLFLCHQTAVIKNFARKMEFAGEVVDGIAVADGDGDRDRDHSEDGVILNDHKMECTDAPPRKMEGAKKRKPNEDAEVEFISVIYWQPYLRENLPYFGAIGKTIPEDHVRLCIDFFNYLKAKRSFSLHYAPPPFLHDPKKLETIMRRFGATLLELAAPFESAIDKEKAKMALPHYEDPASWVDSLKLFEPEAEPEGTAGKKRKTVN